MMVYVRSWKADKDNTSRKQLNTETDGNTLYKDHSINMVNFTKQVSSKKHCLQLYLFQGNQ